jgi:hypothetical protein
MSFERPVRVVSVALCFALCAANTAGGDAEKTWRGVAELTPEEKTLVDLGDDTARDPNTPYLPAERYPFETPYTAEEIGYRLMNFTHLAHWDHVLADVFGVITKEGHLTEGLTLGMIENKGVPNASNVIYAEPGEEYQRWSYFYTYPPKNEGQQQVWVLKRSGREHPTKLDFYVYTPALRRVRRQPPPRRDVQFPDSVQSFDDIVGLDAWEFRWKIIGADTLYDTVRFPKTRPVITMVNSQGQYYEQKTTDIKMMGGEYPFYREDGGVDTFVVTAEPRRDWLPTYRIAKLVYWVDQHYSFPLRIEQYNDKGELKTLQVRVAERQNPDLPGGQGYTNPHSVYWDAGLDLLSYSCHDAMLLYTWSEGERETLFSPDFMRRRWLRNPAKSQSLVYDPKKFHLRPQLLLGRFPAERTIQIADDILKRVEASNAAGTLVFVGSEPDAAAQ